MSTSCAQSLKGVTDRYKNYVGRMNSPPIRWLANQGGIKTLTVQSIIFIPIFKNLTRAKWLSRATHRLQWMSSHAAWKVDATDLITSSVLHGGQFSGCILATLILVKCNCLYNITQLLGMWSCWKRKANRGSSAPVHQKIELEATKCAQNWLQINIPQVCTLSTVHIYFQLLPAPTRQSFRMRNHSTIPKHP